jgi:hypothetical protein
VLLGGVYQTAILALPPALSPGVRG